MLYLDLPRVKEVAQEEVARPLRSFAAFDQPSLLNLSASHASRRLENAGGSNVVCRGRSGSESDWRAFEPHRVTAGDDPPI